MLAMCVLVVSPGSALLRRTTPPSRKTSARDCEVSGPDHARRFTVTVRVNGAGEAVGKGLSKQEAEREAARAMLAALD